MRTCEWISRERIRVVSWRMGRSRKDTMDMSSGIYPYPRQKSPVRILLKMHINESEKRTLPYERLQKSALPLHTVALLE